jgi:hypothetical protein
VTLDEALNELGIDRESDAEGARRAYLRLLKKRKPEVDREGFMRLREAYECVKPYFEQIEIFRALEKAANDPELPEESPGLIRVETPAGTFWVQKKSPSVTSPAETSPDKPASEEAAPPIVEANDPVAPIEPLPTATMEPPPREEAPPPPEVAPPAPAGEEPKIVPDEPTVVQQAPSEPSIDDLIAQGKFKKAAKQMAAQYREAVKQGTFGAEVSAPHKAVELLLQLHQKNRVEEARALEKDFAEWLASTGASMHILAGPLGVQWLFTRELSALSAKFPAELREDIAKSVLAGKLDDAQRLAAVFELNHEQQARDAALALHAHAPTLAKLLGDTLAPPEPQAAPVASNGRGGGTWGIGIVLVVLMNLGRLLAGSSPDSSSAYRGQTDPNAFYRPNPRATNTSYASPEAQMLANLADAGPKNDESAKLDKPTQEKLLKLAQTMDNTAKMTAKTEDQALLQRIRYVRAALEKGSCAEIEIEFHGFVTDLAGASPALKAALLPNAKKAEALLTPACAKKVIPSGVEVRGVVGGTKPPMSNPVVVDGGPKKKP